MSQGTYIIVQMGSTRAAGGGEKLSAAFLAWELWWAAQSSPTDAEVPGSPSAGFCNSNILIKKEVLQMNIYKFPGAPAPLFTW